MRIKREWIRKAARRGACCEAIEWLTTRQRTVEELIAKNQDWAIWAALEIPLPEEAGKLLHRLTGYRTFWRNGKFHRTSGPDVFYPDGECE